MKKSLFLLALLFFCLSSFSQKFNRTYYEIDIAGLSGSDTTITIKYPINASMVLFLDSSTYTGSGGILNIMGSPVDSTIMVGVTHTLMPYTITSDAKRFIKDKFNSTRLGIRVTKGSMLTGIVRLYLVIKYN